MKRRGRRLLAAAVLVGLPVVLGTVEAAAAAGMVIHADPETGHIIPGAPNGSTVRPFPAPQLSTSAIGLVEEPVPGGGVAVNLRGRFQSRLTASALPEGTVRTQCEVTPDARPGDR